jgi:hypothetical protein
VGLILGYTAYYVTSLSPSARLKPWIKEDCMIHFNYTKNLKISLLKTASLHRSPLRMGAVLTDSGTGSFTAVI